MKRVGRKVTVWGFVVLKGRYGNSNIGFPARGGVTERGIMSENNVNGLLIPSVGSGGAGALPVFDRAPKEGDQVELEISSRLLTAAEFVQFLMAGEREAKANAAENPAAENGLSIVDVWGVRVETAAACFAIAAAPELMLPLLEELRIPEIAAQGVTMSAALIEAIQPDAANIK
jgi:hypothetical protein